VLRKLKRIPSIYAAFGSFGVVSRLPVPLLLSQLASAGGNVLMKAQSLRLPSILDAVAKRYQLETVTAGMLDDIVACSREDDRPILKPLFRRHLEQNARGIAIRDQGKVAAYAWAFERTYDLMFTNGGRLLLELPPDVLILGSGYVEPSYRMRGLFPLLIRESALAFGPGRQCWSSTDIWNEVSLASHMRLGFARVAAVACNTLLGVTWFNCRNEGSLQWWRVGGSTLNLSRFGTPPAIREPGSIARAERIL
jgi:hypothetical protein